MKAILVALLVSGLAACAPTPPSDAGRTPASAQTDAPRPAGTRASPASAAGASATQARLAAYHWRLVRATDRSGARIDALFARAGEPLQLDFDANGLSVSHTCNRMRGHWSLADGKLTIGRLVSTLMACPDTKLMALDSAVGIYLNGTMGLTLADSADGLQLALTTSQDDTLAFVGVPTAQTRYGGSGETAFLEVAAQAVPCGPADPAASTCLEIRELHYDDHGLRAGEPGPWHTLQSIEGYTHEPGIRNVVRVKRYRPAAPPAGASSVAYVLDMVVESQRQTR